MPMSFRRVGWLAATILGSLVWMSCGQVYRPVVIPVSTTPPNTQNFHSVFGISSNVSPNPGSALQIDVSGDTDIGIADMGINPTHAAALPNGGRIFVASAGSLTPGDPDLITAFVPASGSSIAIGITSPTVFSLPNLGPEQSAGITSLSEAGNVVTMTLSAAIPMATVGSPIVVSGVSVAGYDGSFLVTSVAGNQIQYSATATGLPLTAGGTATVPLPSFCSYLPDFVATAETANMYVANYGVEGGANCGFGSTDSVAQLNLATGSIQNIAYLNNPPAAGAAPHPVALAETPNALHLYVVNEGTNTVVDLSPTDLSVQATIPVGTTPVWAVARIDNQRVYVLSQGAGTLIPIDTASDTILQSGTNLSVGVGANFLLYDPHLNRLYVTNPSTGQVFVFSATGGVDLSGNPNDTPKLLATISMTAGTPAPCSKACSPVSVTALPDGSRFYVASYESETTCSDKNVGGTSCIIPLLTVFDAPSMTVKQANSTLLPSSSPSLSLLTSPPFSPTQYAVAPVATCAPITPYAPSVPGTTQLTTRFRMFTTASTDGSHVYVSMCDAGAIASVATSTNSVSQGINTPDTLIADISAPFGECSGASCSSAAAITGFSITSNVVTIQAANNFVAGEQVQISGMTAGTYLNGQTLTVLGTGLSGAQFEANFTHADVALTTDSGNALGLQVANITAFSINSNVVTFKAVNTFTPGTRVQVTGLSSTAATNAGLDGEFLTVIATGLSNTQFECVLPTATTSVGSTADSGTAVPQVPPQTPIYLLPGS